jgi:hypothetical protein
MSSGSSLRADVSSALSASQVALVSGADKLASRDAINTFTLWAVGGGWMSGPTTDGCQFDRNTMAFRKAARKAGIQKCDNVNLYWDNELYCTCWFGLEETSNNYCKFSKPSKAF